MRSARVRIKNVQFKDKRIVPLEGFVSPVRAGIEKHIRDAMDIHGSTDTDMAGYAFVIWDSAGLSTCAMDRFPHSNVPPAFIPELVRTRLLAAYLKDQE